MDRKNKYLRGSCDKCCTDEAEDDWPARHQCIMWLIFAAEIELPNVVHTANHTHTYAQLHILQITSISKHAIVNSTCFTFVFYSNTPKIPAQTAGPANGSLSLTGMPLLQLFRKQFLFFYPTGATPCIDHRIKFGRPERTEKHKKSRICKLICSIGANPLINMHEFTGSRYIFYIWWDSVNK